MPEVHIFRAFRFFGLSFFFPAGGQLHGSAFTGASVSVGMIVTGGANGVAGPGSGEPGNGLKGLHGAPTGPGAAPGPGRTVGRGAVRGGAFGAARGGANVRGSAKGVGPTPGPGEVRG